MNNSINQVHVQAPCEINGHLIEDVSVINHCFQEIRLLTTNEAIVFLCHFSFCIFTRHSFPYHS